MMPQAADTPVNFVKPCIHKVELQFPTRDNGKQVCLQVGGYLNVRK